MFRPRSIDDLLNPELSAHELVRSVYTGGGSIHGTTHYGTPGPVSEVERKVPGPKIRKPREA